MEARRMNGAEKAHLEAEAHRECAVVLAMIRESYSPPGPIEAIVIAAFTLGASWAFRVDAELGDVMTAEDEVKPVMPRGCKCDPRDWSTTVVPPVCRRYENDDGGDCPMCVRCEHLEACHHA